MEDTETPEVADAPEKTTEASETTEAPAEESTDEAA